LNAELRRLGHNVLAPGRIIDTLALARRKHPGASNSLDALCDRYRIDRSRRVKHGALMDSEVLVEVYCELTGGRQRSLVLAQEIKAAPSRKRAIVSQRPAPLGLRLEAKEAAAHLQEVQSYGSSAIWNKYIPAS